MDNIILFKNGRAAKVLQSYFLYVPNMAMKELCKLGEHMFPTVVNWFVLCVEDGRKPSEFTSDSEVLKVLRKTLRIYEVDTFIERELECNVEEYLESNVKMAEGAVRKEMAL